MSAQDTFKVGEEVFVEAADDDVDFRGTVLKATASFVTVGFRDGDILSLLKKDVKKKATNDIDTDVDPNYKSQIALWSKENC